MNDAEGATATREARLFAVLAEYESILVAYSGGVDSAYLAWAANRARPGQVLCVTADSPSYPRRHRDIAEAIARQFQLPHEFVHTSELERPEYRANPSNRCYHCKTELYEHLSQLAHDRGFSVIVDGSNADDRGDYRPGRQAAREFGVRSPLDEADLTKAEIRALARDAGLPVWDEPASACLSSRIPYQSEVTEAKLRHHRAGRGDRPRARLPRVPRPPSRHAGAPRNRPRRDGACLGARRSTRRWSAD